METEKASSSLASATVQLLWTLAQAHSPIDLHVFSLSLSLFTHRTIIISFRMSHIASRMYKCCCEGGSPANVQEEEEEEEVVDGSSWSAAAPLLLTGPGSRRGFLDEETP